MYRVLAIALLMFAAWPAQAETPSPVRIGLTAVVVSENLRFMDRWARYLSDKIERPIEFVRRRSYREVMDLLSSGQLEFAWICGFPFIQKRDPEFLKLLVVPIYKGEPLYQSYVIVHRDSPYKTIGDLHGRIFAFSDPESNSGFLYPRTMLTRKRQLVENFFRLTFFTFNHAETIEAVAERVADGGAVDSYIWDYIKTTRPEMAKRTRIIERSQKFGFPPLVSQIGTPDDLVEKMTSVLVGMSGNEEGRELLDGLKLDGFGQFSPDLFASIRDMAQETRRALPWIASETERPR